MLEFNSEHKSFDGSLKDKKARKIKSLFISGILVGSMFLFGGCSKDVECDISGTHSHYYVNEKSFDKYVMSEKETIGYWERTDQYQLVDEEQEKLINFENNYNLYRIDLNKDKIDEIVSLQEPDYIEYEYIENKDEYIPVQIGPLTLRISYKIPVNKMTTDPEHPDLTGYKRIVSRAYYGYKVEKNSKGELMTYKSELVKHPDDLPDEFIYVKPIFYKTVYEKTDKMSLDNGNSISTNKKLILKK